VAQLYDSVIVGSLIARRFLLYLFADADGPLHTGVSEVGQAGGVVIVQYCATLSQRLQVKRLLRRIDRRLRISCNLHRKPASSV